MSTTINLVDYEEGTDEFNVQIMREGVETAAMIPACLIPKLTGESGEPTEFIGRTFQV